MSLHPLQHPRKPYCNASGQPLTRAGLQTEVSLRGLKWYQPVVVWCPYCGARETDTSGIPIVEADGIAHGHADCVLHAYDERRLIQSDLKAEYREAWLTDRCLSVAETCLLLHACGLQPSHPELYRDDRPTGGNMTVKKWPDVPIQGVAAHYDLEDIVRHQVAGGQPYPGDMDEWRRPHTNDHGKLCYGQAGCAYNGDVCSTPECSYAGENDTVRRQRLETIKSCLDGDVTFKCATCVGQSVCCFGKAYEQDDETCDTCKRTKECARKFMKEKQPGGDWASLLDYKPHEERLIYLHKERCFNVESLERACVGCPAGELKDPETGDPYCCFSYYEHNSGNCTEACKWHDDCLVATKARHQEEYKCIPSCEHFEPIRIAVLVMHERSRPAEHIEREMSAHDLRFLLEDQWSQMAMEKLAEWKKENGRNLPFCKEHIQLKGKVVKVPGRRWLRELYLVCPGTGVKRGI